MGGNCFENVPHESLDSCPNDEIAGGVSTRLFYAPTEFLDKVDVPTPTGDYATRITIPSDNLAFKADKGWKGIDILVDEGELKNMLVGNRGNKKSKAELEFFIPGFKKDVVGFIDTFKNVPMVFAVKDSNGVIWLVGTKLNGAFMENAEGTTGKKFEDNSGVTCKINANAKLYVYAGDIVDL
ncbi:conserved hypothetical protein [Tenacibaculum maritimum]|uniref:hypothetical protein n=1 Tax=Tenacibaculum maritimum TaxID=107401 RepID=UPI0012E4FAD1|nr:hypothetical protein [Tenacibaculum maritimum]CAA0172970.1 conserved hypothetical protein [Tenacibaculum maritimum]